MHTPVLFVTGPAGHGKTTAREILCELTHGQRGGSCSDIIYHFLALRRGVSVESLRQIPKEQLRPALIEAGDYLCGSIGQLTEKSVHPTLDDDVFRCPSILIRTLYLNGVNIIDGVRRRLELEDARGHLDWNGVPSVVIHVSNPNGPKVVDNTEDLKDMADEVVVNDGTRDELREKLKAILAKHFGPQDENPEPIPVIDVPAKPQPAAAEVSP